MVAGGDFPVLKPDPKPLVEIAKSFGASTTALVMVGDGPQDVECGHRAGAYTVGVVGGIADRERLLASRPDRLVNSLHVLNATVRALATPP